MNYIKIIKYILINKDMLPKLFTNTHRLKYNSLIRTVK